MKSRFRLGWRLFVRDTIDEPQVFMSGLIAAAVVILVLSIVTGWHP